MLGLFLRRILVASNVIKTIHNEMIKLIKFHYLLFELHSTRPKFDINRPKLSYDKFVIN